MRLGAVQATFADLEYEAKKRTMRCEKFMEEHDLGDDPKAVIDGHLEPRGRSLREGTVVDASIVVVPSSTKNRSGERDPGMYQTRKGKQLWHFRDERCMWGRTRRR